MNSMKRIAVFIAIWLNVIIITALLLTSGGEAAQPLKLMKIPSPEGVTEEFFRCLSSRDFDGADALVYNYRSLGFERAVSDSSADGMLSEYIYNNIFDTYSIAPLSPLTSQSDVSSADLWLSRNVIPADAYEVNGQSASVDISYTCLDSSLLTERLSAVAQRLGTEKSAAGIAVDNDEAAMSLFEESVGCIVSDDVHQYMSTVPLTLYLVYTDGGWQIDVTAELYNALMGKLPEAEQPEISSTDVTGGADSEQ